MKISLINPPWYSPVPDRFTASNLGLSYLTSWLRQNGHEIVPIDALFELPGYLVESVPVKFKYQDVFRIGMSYENISKLIPNDSNFVGIAAPFSNHKQILQELSFVIKKHHPSAKILIGGPYPSTSPEELKDLPDIDFGFNGEAEIGVKQLLSGKSYESIKGLVWRDGTQVKVNGRTEVVTDLDTLPFPARDVFHCNEILEKKSNARIRQGVDIIEKKVRGVPMITSRGCPYDCNFCSIHFMNGYKWRYRSPRNVVDELIELKEKYGVEEVSILDDHLNGNRERFLKIMDLMISENVAIQWGLPNGIRVDYLDREVMQRMKEAGCNSLVIGIQNGSKDMIEKMNTRLDLNKVDNIAQIGKELGLNMASFLIVAYPGETKKLFNESLSFCMKLGKKYGIKDWRINVARAYPNTNMYNDCKKNSLFVRNPDDLLYFPGDTTEANIICPEFTPDEALRRRDYAKRKLMSVENSFYWTFVYYSERLKLKQTLRKIMPDRTWYAMKKVLFDVSGGRS